MDTKLIILISLSALLLFWLLGFIKPIKRKRNRWQAWGFFGQIWGWIDGDKKSILPVSMPPGTGAVFFTLTRTAFVEDGKLGAYTEKSKDGKTIYYNEARKIKGIKKPIRTIVEEITRLRKTENHPYLVEVKLPNSGFTFYFVFTIKAKILNPNKTIKMDEFLIFIGNQLNDRVFPWAVKLEASIKEQNPGIEKNDLANLVIDELIGLNIDEDDSIKFLVDGKEVNLKTYMNKVIDEYGVKVADFSLDVGYDDSVEEVLNLRKEQALELERKKLQEKKNATRELERQKELADETQERELDKKYMEEVAIPQANAQAAANQLANSGWNVDVLTLGEEQKAPSIIIQQRPGGRQRGGGNATT